LPFIVTGVYPRRKPCIVTGVYAHKMHFRLVTEPDFYIGYCQAIHKKYRNKKYCSRAGWVLSLVM
jgi:hypothetical protein